MKTPYLIYLFLLPISLIPLKAQEPLYFIAESGMDFISCAPPEKEYIRGNVEPLFYEFTSGALRGLYYRNYFGFKAEKRFIHDLIGISTGLRYSRSESSIGKNSYWSSPSEYFYLRLPQTGTTTEYLRIRELNQVTGYLGIPLELRIYPYTPRFFNVYYKLGTDFNILVSKKEDAVFYSAAMEKYTDAVFSVVEDPWPVMASLHLGIGFKMGQPGKSAVMWEICFPTALLVPRHGFLTPQAGGGLQLNVRIPL